MAGLVTRSHAARAHQADRMPLMVGLFSLVAILSLVQGFSEFTVPLLLGEEPFALTRGIVERLGAPGLFGAILLHNLGLALLLPGCGLLAAHRETDASNRRLLAPILVAALLCAILVGTGSVLVTAPRAHLPFLLPLAAGEGAAILLVAVATQSQLRRFGTGAMTWRQGNLALQAIRPALLVATVALGALALAETYFLWLGGW